MPEIVASLNAGIPINDNQYAGGVHISTGHYSAGLGIIALKSIDPAILLGPSILLCPVFCG